MRMQRNAIRFFAVAVSALLCSAATAAQTLHLPAHEKVVLKNGLTVLLMEKHGVPIISMDAIVETGATADPIGQEGLASITAGLLRKGMKNRTAQQFSTDMDSIGGSFGAGASNDYTSVSAEFLTKDLSRGLELFCDALLRPTFPREETEKLLVQSLGAIKAAKDSADSVIFEYYTEYLYEKHPYGRPEGGTEDSLKNIQRESVAKFYETYYAPGNTILAVVGDFNAAEMRGKLEQALGGWPSRQVPPISIQIPVPSKGRRLLLVNKVDATQTYFAIGNVGTAANDPDRVTTRLVNLLLGGQFTSMLNEALRVESGLGYSAESFFDTRRKAGPFVIFSYTQNETTAKAVDLALQVLEKLHKDGISAEKLSSAKTYIKGQFPPAIETSTQLAQLIARNEFYGLNDDEVNQLEAKLDAVTPEMAQQAIKKHFPGDDLVFVLIGKASEIGPAVKKYASKLDTREITEPGFWPVAEKK
ncbi:MAG: pitrilysin family protein [Candidatus Acidiferrum sp.]